MAVACGGDFTVAVSEEGVLWSCGRGDTGQLGVGTAEDQVNPVRVGGCDIFQEDSE